MILSTSNTPFDLHEDWELYRADGGRHTFVLWCARYGGNYGCDAEWFAEDYLSVVVLYEVSACPPPTFRSWLSCQPAGYITAHGQTGPEVAS